MQSATPLSRARVAGRERIGLHRYAVAVAVCTGLLVFAGGLVTSTGSGLSVPDWPLSYGQLFPPMVGNVRFEHGHRMVAATVGILTVILAVWLWKREPRRALRRLGLAAAGAVVAQGLLGGLTVLLLLPTSVSVAHACLGQTFFCIVVAIALLTSPGWRATSPHVHEPAGTTSLRTLAVLTVGAVYLQLLLGALMRHSDAGLAIPDFPLAFGRIVPPFTSEKVAVNFAHRVGALLVAVASAFTVARVLRRHRDEAALAQPALLLALLVCVQILLGGTAVWTRKAAVPTTLHVLTGAVILATGVVLALRSYKLIAAPSRAAAVPAFSTPQVSA